MEINLPTLSACRMVRTAVVAGMLILFPPAVGGWSGIAPAFADAPSEHAPPRVGHSQPHGLRGELSVSALSINDRGFGRRMFGGGVLGDPSVSTGSTRGVSTGLAGSVSTSSDASIAASAGSEADIEINARSMTRTIERQNLSISISVSMAVGEVTEPGGVVLARAVDRSIAITNLATDSVTTRSTSTASVRSLGSVADVSMTASADGSAEASIGGGPSDSSTSSAEASIGP
jgi:hypothetical protein